MPKRVQKLREKGIHFPKYFMDLDNINGKFSFKCIVNDVIKSVHERARLEKRQAVH